MNLETNPLLSIITVVFNGEKYLEQTINSVISQNIPNIEYIIIDGGSTDGTIDIINKYSDYISYWISEPDAGIYDAINKGIKASSGKYVGIINSDDWYEPNVFLQVLSAFEKGKCDIVCGLLRLWDDNKLMGIQGNPSDFLIHGMISHPTCFVKQDLYTQVGLFDNKYKIAGDYDFMLRCLNAKAIFNFHEYVIANFRLSGISNQNANLRRKEFSGIQYKNKLITKTAHNKEIIKLIIKNFFKKINN